MIRRGARRMRDVPVDVLADLSCGTVQTANLMEWLATDMGRLASVIAASVPCAKTRASLEECAGTMPTLSVTERLLLAGRAIAQAIPTLSGPGFEFLAAHHSDVVRQWACYAVNDDGVPLSLSARLSATLRFAADANMTVREAAWMSFRPHLARNLAECLTLLGPLSKDSDAYVRRFAIEVTRPRSVWGTHIVALRAVSDQTEAPRHCERSEAIQAATAAYDHWIASSLRSSQRRFSVVENRSKKEPQRALALLENTRADPARYVQLAAGNWLNDASKSRPDWVIALTSRWSSEGNRNTSFIIRRGMRSIVRSKMEQEAPDKLLLPMCAAREEERQC